MTEAEKVAVLLSDKERDIVQRIRDKVAATHWIKGRYHVVDETEKDRYCLVGFINLETGIPGVGEIDGHSLVDPSTERMYVYNEEKNKYEDYQIPKEAKSVSQAIWAAIKRHSPRTRAQQIENWNDRRKTNRDDVLAVLDSVLSENARS